MSIPKLIALAFMMAGTLVQAQFSKGDKMAGTTIGSVIYNSGSSDISVDQIGENTSKITSYNISVNPTLGWFISDKTVVGGVLNINPSGNKTSYAQSGSTYQSDKSNSFNIGLGGFARHYFSYSGAMFPYTQFGFNAGISNLKTEGFLYTGTAPNATKRTYDGSSSGGFFANAGLQAGMTRMLGENAGLDFFIGYVYGYNSHTFSKTTLVDLGNNGSIDETLKNKTTTKYNNHGFLLGVGFQIFLRKKK